MTPEQIATVLHAKGLAIVPIDPTPAQMEASYAPRGRSETGWPNPHNNADIYRAMIAAAPAYGVVPPDDQPEPQPEPVPETDQEKPTETAADLLPIVNIPDETSVAGINAAANFFRRVRNRAPQIKPGQTVTLTGPYAVIDTEEWQDLTRELQIVVQAERAPDPSNGVFSVSRAFT